MMEEITPRIFNRKAPPEASDTYVKHLSQHFENTLKTTAINPKTNEAKKQARPIFTSNHLYGSPNNGLTSASTSAFSKPKTSTLRLPKTMASSATNTGAARHVMTKLQREAVAMMASGNAPNQRRASPIARMRENSVQAAFVGDVTESPRPMPHPKSEKTEISPRQPKSDRDVKEETRRNWKKKAKIAKARKRRQRRVLDDFTIGSGGHFGGNSAFIGCVLDNVERTNFFKKITQCAGGEYHQGERGVASDYEPSEYGSVSSTSGFYSEESEFEEDETTFVSTRASERRKDSGKREGGLRKTKGPGSSHDSSADRSYDHSVDTTVPEELTASFLSAEDDKTEKNSPNRRISSNATKANSATATTVLSNDTDYAHFGVSSSRQQTAAHAYHGSSNGFSFVKAFVEDIEKRGESMLWHQETAAIDPTNVAIRLKKGYRSLDGTYCSPRLTWIDPRKDQNYGFDIFDIQLLVKADISNLKNFPYAIPGRSVMLQLKNSTSFMFEAGTEEDATRFIRGIRGLVARLAHNLVIGNLDVSCELLDLGIVESPNSSLSAFDWSRAVDDVTERLIDNALASRVET